MFGVPSLARIENSYQQESKTQSLSNNQKQRNYYGCLENGEVTQFYFKKLLEQELALSLIVIINLYLIIFSANLSFPTLTPEATPTLNLCLYFTLISALVAIVALIVLRTQTVLQLQKEQKLLYQKASLISSKKILYLILQWIILLVQPYPFLVGHTFSTTIKQFGYQIEYPANDMFTILSFGRIYILVRSALILTPYMSNRSNRLCKMYGTRADYSYSLKCMFKDHPLKLICVFYFLSTAIFAYLVYIAERQLLSSSHDSLEAACTDYRNAFWLILITTTTVGYGDYFPQTPLGRVIILFVAIWGTLIVSIMVVVVSNTLSMQKTEVRTAKILNKLELREKLEVQAAVTIGYFVLANSKRHKEKRKVNLLKMLKAKNQFAQIRKTIKQMAEVNDLEDQIASHFLKLNNDIETLNSNQDKIIDFIHKHFNAQRSNTDSIAQHQKQSQGSSEEEIQSPKFLKLFKNQLKQKLA